MTLVGEVLLRKPENLFEAIKGMENVYIVDTHVDWESLSAMPNHSKSAFILGTTFDKEHTPIRSLFENSQGRKIRYNAFLFGMRSPAPEDVPLVGTDPLLWILRLDEHCFSDGEREKMLQWERSGMSWDDSADVAQDKQRILRLLEVSRIENLSRNTFQKRTAKAVEFEAKIRSELPKCFKDFLKCIEVARYAYAALLFQKTRARNLFSKPNNRHVLGDMQLIQNALFWEANILSSDGDVRWMARLCRIHSTTGLR